MKKPMGGEFTNFIYSSENQLVRMDVYTNTTTKVREVRYTYDALGRRVEKKVIDLQNPLPDALPTTATKCFISLMKVMSCWHSTPIQDLEPMTCLRWR